MKRLAWLLLFASSAAFAQVPVATQNSVPVFDYLIVDFTAFSVTRFEMQLDSGTFASIGVPATTDDVKTLVGAHPYPGPKLGTLGMSVGSHTFASRACNAGGCGIASAPLAFTYAPIPNATANQRLQ